MTSAIEPFVAALIEAVNDMRFRKLSYHWPAQSDAIACAALALVLALERRKHKTLCSK